MSKEQTPISKYLASLERRQTVFTPPPDPNTIIRKINFENDSFCGDQSVLVVTPPVKKRKRLSVLGEALEEEENQNKKMNDLERLLRQTQGELIDARAANTKFEHQISQINRSHNERILGYESSNNELKMKMREAAEKAESFKDQLNRLTKKEEEVREKLHGQAESHFEKISELEKKVRALETENMELRGKFESGTLKQSEELRKLSATLEETEMGAEKWVMETQLLRDQVELKDSQLKKYQTELKEAQSIICKYNELKARFDEPKSPDGSYENLGEKVKYFENLYIKQQTENLRLIQKIEKIGDENRMLRSTMNREMLLEEQISSYEEEVKALRSALETKSAVEADNGILRGELSAWKTMAFKLDPDCTNYLKFEAYIRKIQNQLLEARHESTTNILALADRDRIIAKLHADVSSLQDQVRTVSAEKNNLSHDLKKVTVHLSLVTKDRDGLKELKESYEQEFQGMLPKPLQERINQLEETVAEYEAMIQEEPSNKKACEECEQRIALISEIRTEMERLKREKAEMEAQVPNVSGTGGSDEGDTTGVKIVSFGLNPSSLSLEARLKEAAAENERLKEKIRELKDQTAGPSKESDGREDVEDKYKNLERKFAILSEAYDFETQQLQLILNKLCGFHFTLVREPTVQIRLSSVYSPTQNDAFIFQESPNGDMLLLESPILDNFREDIERFLLREGSIPGFLASVTVTYVQSQSNQQDVSQLPASQQSAMSERDTSDTTITVPLADPREIQVEVRRQRHPTTAVEGDTTEDEDEDDLEDLDNSKENEDDEDMGEEEPAQDEDDEAVEEEENYDEEYGEEEDDDSQPEEESESSVHVANPRFQTQQPPVAMQRRPPPPPSNDSDDSDVIMIDDD